jgi:hypothetical protein
MNWQDALSSLVPIAGQMAIDKLAGELDGLSDKAGDATNKIVLSLIADAVEEHGPAGMALAQDAIEDLLEGKAPDIDWANPRTASDAVALLQNAEADRKNAAREMAERAGHVLAQLGSVVVKALIAAA